MTNTNLARDYMLKALNRIDVLEIFLEKEDQRRNPVAQSHGRTIQTGGD